MFVALGYPKGNVEAAVELRHLRYFVAVAEAENVSRAALKLHVSQPPLSRQIRDLEDELGFLLLKRTAKSVSLTEAGRTFLNEARAVLQRADEGVKKARAVATAGETDCTSATHRRHSPRFCRKPYGDFRERCQRCTSDCTIGAAKPFSKACAMAGFSSD